MKCRAFEKSLHGYFGGLLDPVQRQQMEMHMHGCISCQHLYGKIIRTKVNWVGKFFHVPPKLLPLLLENWRQLVRLSPSDILVWLERRWAEWAEQHEVGPALQMSGESVRAIFGKLFDIQRGPYSKCLTKKTLREYLTGKLGEETAEMKYVREHLDECDACMSASRRLNPKRRKQ